MGRYGGTEREEEFGDPGRAGGDGCGWETTAAACTGAGASQSAGNTLRGQGVHEKIVGVDRALSNPCEEIGGVEFEVAHREGQGLEEGQRELVGLSVACKERVQNDKRRC